MKKYLSAIFFLFCFAANAQKIAVYGLSCEHKISPIGIEDKNPRLSWKLSGEDRNILQKAYSIRVSTSTQFSKNYLVWESGKVNSVESILQAYQGQPLKSGQRYFWQVKVWSNNNRESAWSAPAFWETGLLNSSDWKAQWIEPEQDTANKAMPALMVRKDFNLSKKISSARAYITSHGLYHLSINGEKVGDQVLTPGWTSYDKRLQYQVYDITNLVKQGENAVGALLGDGWYRGALAWQDNWGIYGKTLGLLCQIKINYADGTEEYVVTDKSWNSTSNGPIVMNSIYHGETYDARQEMKGWDMPGYKMEEWKPVKTAVYPHQKLIAMETVPVQRIQEITPVSIFKTPNGTLVADLGQNMVGWIRLKVKGDAGATVTIRHAEVLDKYGEFYTENLRAAKATMTYTLKGGTEEVYEPYFTFFGFRYVAVDGFPGELKPENITGVVIHSNMKPTGTFECSNPLVNQLQHNIQWGQKGNFVDVPTDCPQRDERLGWTGDAQAFCRTAAFNMDVAAFFSKWLKDVSADQYANGAIPFVIPDVLRNGQTSAGWGDVITIAPWDLYQVFGDKKLLEEQYAASKAYVEYIMKKSGDDYIWDGGSVFGDWLYYKPRMENHTEPDGHTSPDMIATMFYAYSAKLLSNIATELGKKEDAALYAGVFEKVKNTFIKEYVTPSGRIASDSQTAYVLALQFGLLPDNLRPVAAQNLVNDIKRRNTHLSTGFLGTPYLCHVLSDNGHLATGYDLLLQETFPSWLFPVKMGATTIWERWDGQKPDSTFQDKGMNSFNHYAYGAIGDWMYRVVAGIEIGKPGYKMIKIQPKPDNRLSYANATFESSYGQIASGWERKDGKMTMRIKIPANTTALVTLPGTEVSKVIESGSSISGNKIYQNVRDENNNVILEVGSGEYVFSYPINQ